jgi:hypothetical protein
LKLDNYYKILSKALEEAKRQKNPLWYICNNVYDNELRTQIQRAIVDLYMDVQAEAMNQVALENALGEVLNDSWGDI